jgi:hypothetical protein
LDREVASRLRRLQELIRRKHREARELEEEHDRLIADVRRRMAADAR